MRYSSEVMEMLDQLFITGPARSHQVAVQEYTAGGSSAASIGRDPWDGQRVAQAVHSCTRWFDLTSRESGLRGGCGEFALSAPIDRLRRERLTGGVGFGEMVVLDTGAIAVKPLRRHLGSEPVRSDHGQAVQRMAQGFPHAL